MPYGLLMFDFPALKEDNSLPSPEVSPAKENELNVWNRSNSNSEDDSPTHHNRHRRSVVNSPHDKLEYEVHDLDEKSLENDISAFVTTMFWLLEKTRVEKTAVDSGSKVPPLLCAPFEKRG